MAESLQAPTNGDRRILAAIAIAAFALRVVALVATRSWDFSPADGHFDFGYEMGKVGEGLANGSGFAWPSKVLFHQPGPTAWMPPIYPLIIAAVFRIFGTFTPAAAVVLELLQASLSAAFCVLAFFLGRQLFDRRAGVAAAMLLAAYPAALHFSVQKIWSTDLFVFCLLLSLLLVLRLGSRPTAGRAVLTGAALGFTALVDPMLTGFWFLVLGWLYIRTGLDARATALVAAVALVVVAPWLIRNWMVFGRFVYIKSNFAIDAYMANVVPGTEPTSAWEEVDEMRPRRDYGRELVEWARANPRELASKSAARFRRYWTAGSDEASSLRARAASLVHFLVLGAAIVGAVTLLRGAMRSPPLVSRETAALLLLAVLSLPVPYYLAPRRFGLHYRFPEVLLMLFASGPVAAAYAWVLARRRP